MASYSPGFGRQDGAPSGAPLLPAPGVVLFGRYRLEEALGQGGTAEVWRAYDLQLERQVAIKLLHRRLLPDERSRQRFAAEARTVAGLSHPGIVTLHDVVVDDQQAAIVLELVDGEPLNDLIARTGRVSEVGAAAITAQVAHALQAAHDRGLVHRDVKPANVLLSPDGRARLVDFGIARALDDRESGMTQPGTIMGTLRYMAPEQLADGAADRGTDVFGLGSLLYEMLVARPPFPAATPAALMAQQRQGAPALLRITPELAGIARTALQHDAERRPRTAGQMAALLERWLERQAISSADLPAVTVAALHGGLLPRPAPIVTLPPAITPAPIVESASGPVDLPAVKPRRSRSHAQGAASTPVAFVPHPSTDGFATPPASPTDVPGRRRRSRTGASDQLPLATTAAADVAPLPLGGTQDPSALAAAVAAAALASPSGGLPFAASDDAARVRASARAPFRFGGRRVPIISAVGLAGVLLAVLLLAGALTALQAGTGRPGPTPAHVPATASPAAAATQPVVTVTATPTPPVTTASPGKPGPKPSEGKPKPSRRRDNTD